MTAGTIDKTSTFRDNTMLGSYKECPRRFQLRHVLGWRSEGTSLPLSFGLSWHESMDQVWQYAKKLPQRELHELASLKFLESWEEQGLPTQLTVEDIEKLSPRTPLVASEMLHKYIESRWKMLQEAELIACEQPFAVPIPESTAWYVGRLDKVVRYNGQVLVVEHKTTTEYKKDGGFKTAYVEGWYSDSQVKGYQYGGGLFFGTEQVWVDAALVHKSVHDKFRLVPVAHQHPLLLEWLGDTRDWNNRIERDLARSYFPKNENSCYGKFGACPFLDICRTTADPAKLTEPPAGYVLERWEPFDILGLDKLVNKEPK